MKKLIFCTMIFAISNAAKADQSYICRNQNQIALLKIGEQKEKLGSYDECNMGVGDEPTDCHPHAYRVNVRESVLKFRVKEGYLNGSSELTHYGSSFSGYEILLYKNYALQIKISGNITNPFLQMLVMKKGLPGKPIEVGNYQIPCRQFR